MKALYLIRHGESEGNAQKIFSSRLEVPLTQHGREQVATAGRKAREQGLVIDLMLVSPLLRTKQTADILDKHISPSQREEYGMIIERDISSLDGVSYMEYADFTEVKAAIENTPDVETWGELVARAASVIDAVSQRHEDCILLVSHGDFGMALLEVARAKGSETVEQIDDILNAQIIRIF